MTAQQGRRVQLRGAIATKAARGSPATIAATTLPQRQQRPRAVVCAAAAAAGDEDHANTSATPRRAVVVTGASSGIGKATAQLLVARGWRVFAGVRSAADAAALAALGAEPVSLDVGSAAGVRAAAADVAARLGPGAPCLQGLVCNAGFGTFLPVEFFPEDAFAAVMDTNVTGALRCVQAFLPLLRGDDAGNGGGESGSSGSGSEAGGGGGSGSVASGARGRVVLMSSIAGSVGFPLFGAYSASKHALEAMGDCLRFEVGVLGCVCWGVCAGCVLGWGACVEKESGRCCVRV